MVFSIVAIGASAGGLEAISELLAALPPTSDLAYVVIQHLDPVHMSLLTELLSKKTAMPVETIHEGLALEGGHVYVIPPNTLLTLKEDRFQLTARDQQRHPIDVFFASLASERGDTAIGVVLSGGDSDGTHGVQEIKHAGGIAMAQSPESARFPGMPNHAIETDCVDFVGRPSEIARELTRLGRHPYLRAPPSPEPERVAATEPAARDDEEALRRVFRRLRSVHGVDFTHYKRSTLRRRLARRMALRKVEGLADYVGTLEDDPAEAAALYQDFLIRVTGFFRDPQSFEGLRQRVFPSMCERRTPKDPVRIWIPGCASGEEVYSIAIALVEYLGEQLPATGIQIFGTDVSEAAIEKARAARYPDSIAEEVSAERLARFFVKEDHHYCIAKSIRDLCIFARQDVTRDAPFSRLDLVSCRNLLIYLDGVSQRRVMQVFHYALKPTGFLLLGPSESVGTASNRFELLDKQHRIYTRKAVHAGAERELELSGTGVRAPPQGPLVGEVGVFSEGDSAQREADRVLSTRFAPASLLVDEELNILQVRGETGPYLELASGQPSLNLNRVARPELLVQIHPAIQEARDSGAAARREGLSIDQRQDLSIEVIPLKRSSAERAYLVVFEDAASRAGERRAQRPAQALSESEKDRRLAQLERENAAMREYLQATMEEHEAAREELKSAHEEMLSSNEEFQSTNEELETAKEELQSANEELTTTNDELRNRNRDLSVLNSEVQRSREIAEHARTYADAIVNTVREPLLVLDGDLKILRANVAFYAIFKTQREEVEGRLLSEMDAAQWNLPPLIEQLHAVLRRDGDGVLNNFDLAFTLPQVDAPRTLRVNARKIPGDTERSELILLAVDDVTERMANAEQLREVNQRKDEFLAMLAHELRNPLTPIAHAIHLLRRGEAAQPSTVAKLFDLIDRQTTRLIRLVDDLLDVARISSGRIQLKRDTINLAEVVQHALEASRPRLEERRHQLTVLLSETAVWVDGDPIRLEQVVSNLLENAAKYTESGGRIELALREERGEVTLSVRDNGIGLAAKNQESIFDLFTQIDTSLAHSGGGLGIGLTLVRRVLALHSGSIEAHSAGLGHGTQFIVRLPVVAAPSASTSSAHTAPSVSAADGHARRVLIVDDSEDTGESVAMLARSWGHEVAIAHDGPAALTLAQAFRPERALVDIGLPGMDGFELARRLRAAYPQLYLVAMTGYGRAEDRKAALKAGFDLHCVKPVDVEELQELLANGHLARKLGGGGGGGGRRPGPIL